METNLFGEKAPPQGGKCAHLNVTYRLECHAHIKVQSRYEEGVDTVEEIERHVSWTGQVNGTCQDCGKALWYTASNIPKFIKRRLRRANVFEVQQSPYLGGGK